MFKHIIRKCWLPCYFPHSLKPVKTSILIALGCWLSKPLLWQQKLSELILVTQQTHYYRNLAWYKFKHTNKSARQVVVAYLSLISCQEYSCVWQKKMDRGREIKMKDLFKVPSRDQWTHRCLCLNETVLSFFSPLRLS